MCFSANASFGAGIVLSVIGVASFKKARQPSQMLFASIPLIFAVQQISEGFLWLALSDHANSFLKIPATYTFLFFAQVVWPCYVPLAILFLEIKGKRKKLQKALVVTGLLVSTYLGYCLIFYSVDAKIEGSHISYALNFPLALQNYGGLLYVVSTVAPPFFSCIKRMWWLGLAILISYIITNIFYTDYIVSVWCFFASVISIAVYIIMYEVSNMNRPVTLKN